MSSLDDEAGSQPSQDPDAGDSLGFKFSAMFLGALVALIVSVFMFRCVVAQCTKYFGRQGRLRGRRRRAREARLIAEAQQVIRRHVAGMAEEGEDYMALSVRVNGAYNNLQIMRNVVDDDTSSDSNHHGAGSDDGHGLEAQHSEQRGRARTHDTVEHAFARLAPTWSMVEPGRANDDDTPPPATESTLGVPLRRFGRLRRTPEEVAAREVQLERSHQQSMLNPNWPFL